MTIILDQLQSLIFHPKVLYSAKFLIWRINRNLPLGNGPEIQRRRGGSSRLTATELRIRKCSNTVQRRAYQLNIFNSLCKLVIITITNTAMMSGHVITPLRAMIVLIHWLKQKLMRQVEVLRWNHLCKEECRGSGELVLHSKEHRESWEVM